ncbi:hypothetical protein ACVR05_02130 [Streptococcus caprae]|uniref:YopX protein domain-containing protein n=1 Tax=Streptococcus caprae TaxID=1640501 RepID=A0ABV8CWX2_9STRE
MNQSYIVYNGKVYTSFDSTTTGCYLLSSDESKLNEGYEPYKTTLEMLYRKFVPNEEIEQKYQVYDMALIDGREYDIHNYGDKHFTEPDSFIQISTDHIELLKKHNWTDGAYVIYDKYGTEYVSGKIPASEVAIIRRRKILPIEGK